MYDVDGSGWIDLAEMTKLVKSLHQLMNERNAQLVSREHPADRARTIFRQMDADGDGKVTREEFVSTCLEDQKLIELLTPQGT
jgi:Ca2+-binding EF-hand superfamily protein